MIPKSAVQEKPKRSASRKKWLRILGVGLLTLLTLEFALYFGSNLLLGNLLRKKLNESFNGVYGLDFNRVHLSLIRRGIFLDGIVMKPTHPDRATADQVLFELTLDEIVFSGLWFWDQELYVREISLDRPNFQVLTSPIGQDAAPSSSSQSPVILLENELKKSISNLPLSGVKVGSLVVENAQIFFLNFLFVLFNSDLIFSTSCMLEMIGPKILLPVPQRPSTNIISFSNVEFFSIFIIMKT